MYYFFSYIKEHPYAGFILFLLSLAYFSNQFDRYIFSSSKIPFLDYQSYEYGLLVGPIFTVMYSVAGLLISPFGESHRVQVLTLSIFVWSVIICFVSFTSQFWQVAILTAGLAVGEAGCTPFAAPLLGDIFPEELQGTALGIYNLSIYLGYGVAVAIGPFLQEKTGWKTAYVLAGFFGIAIALLTCATVKDEHSKNQQSLHGSSPTYATLVEHRQSRHVSLHMREHSVNSASGAPMRSRKSSLRLREASMTFTGTDLAAALENAPPPMQSSTVNRVWQWWRRTPSLTLLCLASGLRKGAGTIWADYTALFFSPLFSVAPASQQGVCHWSFNESSSVLASISGEPSAGVCPVSYPYCLKDSQRCARLTHSPWHDQGMSEEQLQHFIAWVPLVAGGCGVFAAGIASDHLVKHYGPVARLYLLIGLTVAAAPFSAGILLLGYPWCFISMIFCDVLGEGWTGLILTLILDSTPNQIRASSISIFMFISTNIGGNMALLCPFIQKLFGDVKHTFTLQIYPTFGSNSSSALSIDVIQPSSIGLEWALFVLFPGLYVLSIFVFIIALRYQCVDFPEYCRKLPPISMENFNDTDIDDMDRHKTLFLGSSDQKEDNIIAPFLKSHN